jgi:hypothetical protein
VTPTQPTASPTPAWTPVEQEAIAIVQRYYEVSTQIAHNQWDGEFVDAPEFGPDAFTFIPAWQPLWDEVVRPDAEPLGLRWWQDRKFGYLVGEPTFTPTGVTPAGTDDLGDRYLVSGCWLANGAYVTDANNNPTSVWVAPELPRQYEVLHQGDGRWFVDNETTVGQVCA